MNKIAYRILWSSIEDYVGLWEVLWELNTDSSGASNEENRETIKIILRYLLENNLVIAYLSKWGSDELEAKNTIAALNLLDEQRFWSAPELNEICLKIGSTQKGEKYYYEELLSGFINE